MVPSPRTEYAGEIGGYIRPYKRKLVCASCAWFVIWFCGSCSSFEGNAR